MKKFCGDRILTQNENKPNHDLFTNCKCSAQITLQATIFEKKFNNQG